MTDENATLFYNPLKKAAANLGDETDPIKVLNELRSFENVTDDQIKFSGIDQYLESKAALGEGTSLDEVREFIDQNRIKLYESYRDDGGGSSRYIPEDLEIRERAMYAEDPDESYLSDMADNEEEYLRNFQADDIYEDVLMRYPELDHDQITEKVDEIIADRAYEAARDAYWEDPIYRGENDLGYVISGNRNQGYIVRGPNGQDIRPNRGYFDDVDDANIAIVEHAQENGLIGDPTKRTIYGENSQYSQYMMPGGSNYRELNIGLEAGSKDKSAGKVRLYEEYINRLEEEAREIRREYPIMSERPPEVAARIEEISNKIQVAYDLRQNAKSNSNYGADAWYGGHFEDDPDLFAQLRLQDYQDVDGMSGTLIDEAQSDMHQKGREKGYKGSSKEIEEKRLEHGLASADFQEHASSIRAFGAYEGFNELLNDMTLGDDDLFFKRLAKKISENNKKYPQNAIAYPETESEIAKIKEVISEGRKVRELADEQEKLEYGIPDAPFKKDWYHVAIRRAIKDAIDNGKDRVYLPTGEALANRYNYANAVDQIAYTERDDGKFNIAFKDFDGRWHNSIGNQSFSNLKPGDLDSILGKEMAKKIREGYKDSEDVPENVRGSGYSNLIENQSIDVGGKGFKKYYDETYPNFMKKEANEFGAKTGYTKIPTPVTSDAHREKLIRSTARANRISADEMRQRIRNWSQGQRDNFFNNRQEPVFYIEINDAMREAYGKGRPYARGGLVTDALDAVEEHFQKGGKVKAKKDEGEAKNIEPVPLLGRIAGMLGESSEFLKSRPLKEEGSWQAKGAASAVNSVLELVDQFFVNDLAKTADRMAYGFPVTSGKGETLKPLPETTGAVLTVAPPAAKLASKTARLVKNAAPLMEQATKQGAETVFDMLERYTPQPMYVVPKDESKFLPLAIPRTRRSKQQIEEAAERVSRQMMGEHVRNPERLKEAKNLAGRSMKESERVKNIDYTLEKTKDLPEPAIIEPKVGDVNVATVGDITVADRNLVDVNGYPIHSVQEGGPFYGKGKLHLPDDESLWWASEPTSATNFQNRVNEIANHYGVDKLTAQHMAMGQRANNFAMHFADANLKAIATYGVPEEGIAVINNAMRQGFSKLLKGNRVYFAWPDFPGVENIDEAYKYFRANPEARKWFNDRMKTPEFTEPNGLPNGLDVQWAITDPVLRNMEINLTGRSVGDVYKGAEITDTAGHGTYGAGIRGRFRGTSEYPIPAELSFSDAWDYTAARKRPADITGTMHKIAPHQVVDQQYLDEIGRYNELMRKYIGKKEGGVIDNDDEPPLPRNAGEVEEWRRKLKAYEDRQYWKRRGANSADEDDSPRRLEEQRSYPMRTKVPEKLNKYFMPEFREEDLPFKKALRYYQQGGNVDGFKITKTYPVAPEAKKQKRSKAEAAFANWSDWQNMPRIPREAGAPGYKGLGYFGRLPSVDKKGNPTYSTELAGEMDGIHFPLLVPTLSKDEVSQLLAGKPATDAIWKKAYEHALMRGRGAKSPFATQYDMPVERPR